jgi:flagellar biosynthesis anti-sigma factor FlgM
MSVNIQNLGQQIVQPEIDPSATAANGKTSGAGSSSSANSNLQALNAAQDTATINTATVQLSGDLPIRQDRVDALRAQIEAGTYTVNAHAVATAMFQNLFRS